MRAAASALERRLDIPEDRDPALLALLAAVNFALVLWTFHAALTVLPNTGDEFSALFQAKIFASGRLTAPAPAVPQPFLADYIAARGGRWFSIYPPGHALLLALGLLLGDATVVPAMLSSATLVVAFLVARRAGGRGAAWLAVALLFAAPSFRFYSASYYSHTTSLLSAAVCVLFALQWRDPRPGSRPAPAAFAAAALLGLAARPFETFWILVPIGAWLFAQAPRSRRFHGRSLLSAGGLAAVAAALLVAFNERQNGTFWPSLYVGLVNSNRRLNPARTLSLEGLVRLSRMCADASKWLLALGGYSHGSLKTLAPNDVNLSTPVLAAALALGWRESRGAAVDARARRLLLAVVAFAVFGHLFYDKAGGPFGERRFYEISGILCLFVARLYLTAARRLRAEARTAALAVLVLAPAALTLPGTILSFRDRTEARMDPFLRAQRAGVHDALIFVHEGPEFYPQFYARNEPDLRGNVFVTDGAQNAAVAALLPGRPRYRYFFDWPRGDFSLQAESAAAPGGP
jgi:hypothetical protein